MSRPYNRTSFADHYETEIGGLAMVQKEGDHFAVQILDAETQDILAMHVFTEEDQAPLVSNGESVVAGQPIASGSFINDIFYIHLARVMLIGLFVFICALVWRASMNRSHSES